MYFWFHSQTSKHMHTHTHTLYETLTISHLLPPSGALVSQQILHSKCTSVCLCLCVMCQNIACEFQTCARNQLRECLRLLVWFNFPDTRTNSKGDEELLGWKWRSLRRGKEAEMTVEWCYRGNEGQSRARGRDEEKLMKGDHKRKWRKKRRYVGEKK